MDGQSVEYANESNAARIVGVVGAFHFLAFSFVSLRIYARVVVLRAFGLDDALIVVAAVRTKLLALASWICLVLQIPHGLGRHATTIAVDERIKFEQITFWKTVISDGVAMGLLRISMAYTLLRLKRDLNWYKWSLYAVMVWLFVYCTPYSGWWEFQWMNPFDPRCHDFNVFLNLTYWNISCNIFTDVCLGALPIPIIWSLKMKLRVRIYVIAILNLGYFAVLMGILKAVFMLTTGGAPDAIFDYWFSAANHKGLRSLQLNIGIIAACASFLKPLVGRYLKINSSAGYYPSYERYNHSGRTPLGAETGGSKAQVNSKRRTVIHEGNLQDEYELQKKGAIHIREQQMSPTTTEIHAGRYMGNFGDPMTSVYPPAVPSDTNSEELILQKTEPAQGIVCTRNFTPNGMALQRPNIDEDQSGRAGKTTEDSEKNALATEI
ncbi:hypothetical protein GCG54_00003960 [Colletotrichum gloeosporioides]|uniref:Rhodopsin domain-containing protein n=1 Tax=Colletotrichum gloeosporioides TaxID=474922 RepID=A0A8H4C6G0_COLGL|nr:uncharacterized protein GCG54_00003960 [Colletotrichum gloeosporioides]KAF3798057.1 hypothetical protein GCG54_00003960 [Colletotrichum gloeosporioides]